jgi:GNAT superfamily N-acetyltransferase
LTDGRDHRRMAFTLRRAGADDADALADLYLRARHAASATIPPPVHSEDEVRQWMARRVVRECEAWVAESPDGVVIGLLVLDGEWIDQLYVEATRTGCGIGSALLEHAKRARPGGLRLWTFESNMGAQRFYEQRGFRAADRTAGDNQEGAPDILYVWD